MKKNAYSLGALLALRSEIALVGPDADRVWVHVAYEGVWEGHPSGPFEMNAESFNQMISNFEVQENPALVDYEHASEWANEAPAAGWVHQLEIRKGSKGVELWALVELTAKAAQYIRNGEYRYSSGVFDFGGVDRKSGEEIGAYFKSLALTNIPFIDGQEAIALSHREISTAVEIRQLTEKSMEIEELVNRLRSLDDSQMAALVAAVEAKVGESEEEEETSSEEAAPSEETSEAPAEETEEEEEETSAAVEPPSDEPAAEPVQEEAAAEMLMSRLMEMTGMSMEELLASIDSNREMVTEALMASGDPAASAAVLSDNEDEVKELAQTVEENDAKDAVIRSLSHRVAEYEAREAKTLRTEMSARVDALINEGRLEAASRGSVLKVALANREAFELMEASLRPVVPTGATVNLSARTQDESDMVPDDEQWKAHIEVMCRAFKNPNRSEEETRKLARRRLAELDKNNSI